VQPDNEEAFRKEIKKRQEMKSESEE